VTPQEFLDQVVRPNVLDFETNYGDIRHAFNAVHAVDALAAHIFRWCVLNNPAEVEGHLDDTNYREHLSSLSPMFRLLRDIAKAQKHVSLVRGEPLVQNMNSIESRPIGWGEGAWGEMRWGGPPQVVASTTEERTRAVEAIITEALAFLTSEMSRLNIS
jgi:hypothetical protein